MVKDGEGGKDDGLRETGNRVESKGKRVGEPDDKGKEGERQTNNLQHSSPLLPPHMFVF